MSGVAAASPRRVGGERPTGGERAAFILWLAGLAAAPLWFGSNVLPAIAFNAVLFGIAAALFEVSLLQAGRAHPVPLRRLALPTGCLGLTVLWIVLQWAPGTPSSLWNPIWGIASDTLDVAVAGRATVDPDATLLALLRLATATLVFWLAVQFGWTRERADRTLLVLACAGTFYCLFGLVSHLAAPGRLLWLDAAYPDAVTATFVNRNTFATYAGITMVTLIALVTNLYRRAAEQGGGRRTRTVSNIIDATAGRAGLLLLAIVVTLAALFMSTSRGGVMASLVAVLFFAAMFAWRGWRQGGKVSFAVLGVSLVFLPVSLVVFGSSFVERLDRSGLESESRLPAYSIVWDSIKDSPLVGFGYGTFRSVFPMYRDQRLGVWGSWDKAHNTYLELAQGLGLPVAAIFVLAVVLVFVRVTRGAVGRRRFATSAFVASCATVLVGLHALVDFSLQIQAVALTWTALLGLGFAQSFSTRSSQSKPVGATAPRPAEWIR